MAADTISGYIQGLLDGIEFKQTVYALDRDSRKAALARFLKGASDSDQEAAEEERRLAAILSHNARLSNGRFWRKAAVEVDVGSHEGPHHSPEEHREEGQYEIALVLHEKPAMRSLNEPTTALAAE